MCTGLLLAAIAVTDVAVAATVIYTPSDELFAQPERGLYAHREVQAEGAPMTVGELTSLRSANITLVLRLYYLKSFRVSPLSQGQLDLITADMVALRTAGVKAIVRFAYSQAQAEPDAPLVTILSHLDQLEPLLRDNADVIAVVQAGFIGSWGEWYYSSNNLDNTADRQTVLTRLLAALPLERTVQVRTPAYKQDIFATLTPLTAAEAFSGVDRARTGHHNDCFLASDTDFGTYIDPPADKAWLSQENLFVAMGGETCNPNPPRSECATALVELAQLRWSYLNRDYHPTVLASWVTGGCMTEIERRLGHRLRLDTATVSDRVASGDALALDLDLYNDGFAPPYNPRGIELWLRATADGSLYFAPLPVDPRRFAPAMSSAVGELVGASLSVPTGRYDSFLRLPDPHATLRDRPEYAIRLANDGLWEPASGLNALSHALDVEATGSAVHVGPSWLRPVSAALGEPRLLLTRAGADGVDEVWIPASGAAARYHVYTGTLASLTSGTYDHQATLLGLTFPDSSTVGDGCDASAGTVNAARVDGVGTFAGLYFRVLEVDALGNEGPIGHDPAADPRPSTWRCP